MKTEPSFDKKVLEQKIKEEYNFVVKNFKFIPEGEFASSYVILTESNEKYFLKLYFPSQLKEQKIKKLNFSIKIAYQLYNKHGINQIPHPLKTLKGAFKSQFQDAQMVLWNFIEGKVVSEKKSKTDIIAEKLAELLARIHNSTSNLDLEQEHRLKFELVFKDDLLASLREIATGTTSTDKTFLRLQGLITPLMNDILQALTYLEELSDKLRKESPSSYVVCHTDPIRHNILIDKQGEIYLVDWDDAMFAPIEQDVWFYLNEKNSSSFKQKYKEISKIKGINEDMVIYLFYERTLADLTDWVYRILFEETNSIQVKSDFEGLKEDVLPVLLNMKEIENNLRRKAKEW